MRDVQGSWPRDNRTPSCPYRGCPTASVALARRRVRSEYAVLSIAVRPVRVALSAPARPAKQSCRAAYRGSCAAPWSRLPERVRLRPAIRVVREPRTGRPAETCSNRFDGGSPPRGRERYRWCGPTSIGSIRKGQESGLLAETPDSEPLPGSGHATILRNPADSEALPVRLPPAPRSRHDRTRRCDIGRDATRAVEQVRRSPRN